MKNNFIQNKKIKKIITEVAEVARYLWKNGWAERNAGNISVNLTHFIDGNNSEDENKYPTFELPEQYPELVNKYFLVTGTGKRMRDLAQSPLKNALIIKIIDHGRSYEMHTVHKRNAAGFMPTSELPTHLSIHQQIALRGSGEKVIIHTHANELVALTQSPEIKSKKQINNIIWGMHPEAMVFIPKGVGFVPYTIPGSIDIAKLTLEEFKTNNIILWEKHGVFAIGDDVLDTFDNIEIVSKSAKIWFMCKQAGFEPEGLTDSQLNELKEIFM